MQAFKEFLLGVRRIQQESDDFYKNLEDFPLFSQVGQFQDMIGQKKCNSCPRGSFSVEDGAVECEQCPAGTTTKELNSVEASECKCPAGKWQHGGTGECIDCTRGMICNDVGQAYPGQMAGYQVMSWDAHGEVPLESDGVTPDPARAVRFEVFKCVTEKTCPESAIPGACPTDGDPTSKACGKCVEDHFMTEPGTCKKCTGIATLQIAAIVLFFFGLVLGSYYFVNSPLTKKASPMLSVSVMCGMILMLGQSMGVISRIGISWDSPFKSFLGVMGVFMFNVDAMGADCLLGSDELTKFCAKVFIPLGILCLYVCCYLAPLGWKKSKTFNTTGQVFTALYITIVGMASSPLQCYNHPDNGKSSMVEYPDVICWEGTKHPLMVLVSLIFLTFYGLGFFAVCAFVNINAPRLTTKSQFGTFGFLFKRFRADRWWWGSFLLFRNLIFAFVPVFNSSQPAWQLITMTAFVSISLVVHLFYMPYKLPILNILEAAVLAAVNLVCVCGMVFVPTSGTVEKGAAVLSLVVIMALFAMLFATIVYGFRDVLRQRHKSARTGGLAQLELPEAINKMNLTLSAEANAEETERLWGDIVARTEMSKKDQYFADSWVYFLHMMNRSSEALPQRVFATELDHYERQAVEIVASVAQRDCGMDAAGLYKNGGFTKKHTLRVSTVLQCSGSYQSDPAAGIQGRRASELTSVFKTLLGRLSRANAAAGLTSSGPAAAYQPGAYEFQMEMSKQKSLDGMPEPEIAAKEPTGLPSASGDPAQFRSSGLVRGSSSEV